MARGRKSPMVIELTKEEKETLEHWQRSTVIPAGLARRGRIILLLAQKKTLTETAKIVGMERCNVRKWAKRFLKHRIEGLYDQKGRGRKPFFPSGGNHSPDQNSLGKTKNRVGRSLSQWDCSELARELQRYGIVNSISAENAEF